MSHFPSGILVIGTAYCDQVIYAGDLTANFERNTLGGKKTVAETLRRSGGSAQNTALALHGILPAMGLTSTVFKCMRLGCAENNPGKEMILRELGNPKPGDFTLIDPMFGKDYAVPTNFVIENGPEDNRNRFVMRTRRPDLVLGKQTFAQIRDVLPRISYVIGNSNPVEETLFAMEEAKKKGLRTILDYSEKEPSELEHAVKLVPFADHIVAPHDALLPGMKKTNPHELLERLCDDYGRTSIAISNAEEDVLCWHNNKMDHFTIRKVKPRNVNGAGDTRDAALVAGMSAGLDFIKAVKFASDIATFYVQQPSRADFIKNLPDFIKSMDYQSAAVAVQDRHLDNPGLDPSLA